MYANGVPLTESQFRELWAAMQAELEQLPPAKERKEWDMKRQYEAVTKFSVYTGLYPLTFPMLGNFDQAWEWYAVSNKYVTGN